MTPWTDARRSRLIELHTAGLSLKQLAGALGGFDDYHDFGRGAVSTECARLGLRRYAKLSTGDVWTPERIEELKRLYADRRCLSASEIAHEMGCFRLYGDGGRSAVLGKIHRLNMPSRETNPQGVRRAPRTRRGANKPTVRRIVNMGNRMAAVTVEPLSLPAIEDGMIPPGQRKTFMQLENIHCRWPLPSESDRAEFYCGSPTADVSGGIPYCASHKCRSVTRPMPALDRARALVAGRKSGPVAPTL